MKPLLICKDDCDFETFLTTPSIFKNDLKKFSQFVVENLNHDISCRTYPLAQYLAAPKSAADLLKNLGK